MFLAEKTKNHFETQIIFFLKIRKFFIQNQYVFG